MNRNFQRDLWRPLTLTQVVQWSNTALVFHVCQLFGGSSESYLYKRAGEKGRRSTDQDYAWEVFPYVRRLGDGPRSRSCQTTGDFRSASHHKGSMCCDRNL